MAPENFSECADCELIKGRAAARTLNSPALWVRVRGFCYAKDAIPPPDDLSNEVAAV